MGYNCKIKFFVQVRLHSEIEKRSQKEPGVRHPAVKQGAMGCKIYKSEKRIHGACLHN